VQRDYDIFFSHARNDLKDPVSGPAITALLAALKTAGLRVFHDAAEIDESKSITARIVGALAHSTLFLAWYSPLYPTRRACQWELTAAILAAQTDPADAQALDRRIAVLNPVEKPDHIQPLLLRDRVTVDTRSRNWPAFAATLKARLGQVQGPFGRIWANLRPQWYGSPERLGSTRFVGRVPDLWAVHDGLVRHGLALVSGAPVGGAGLVQVRGMGGIGKSLLSEEYALRFASAWPGGVFWLTATGAVSPSAVLARVGKDLKLPDEELRDDRIRGVLMEVLEERGSYLWVVDDLPATAGHDELLAWKAPTGNGHTLVTTRSSRLDSMGYCHSLDRLDMEEALTLLTGRRPVRTEAERTAAGEILELLDNHALAVDVASAAVASEGYGDFLELLRNPSEDALDFAAELAEELPGGHNPQIAATLLDSVRRLNADGTALLHLAALLASAPIPRDFIVAVFGRMAGDTGKGFKSWIKRLLHRLRGRGPFRLITPSLGIKAVTTESLGKRLPAAEGQPESVSVHILVGRTLRHHGDTAPAGLRDAVLAELLEIFGENTNDIRRQPVLMPLLPHARALTSGNLDVAGADLLGWLGRMSQERGAYREAAADIRRELQAMTALQGPEHPDTLISMNNLAATLWSTGDHIGARTLEEQVLEIRRRVLGPEHPRTLTSMNNLASTLWSMGDHAGARTLLGQVLQIHRQVLGPEHPNTLISMGNLASTLGSMGDHAGARTLEEQVLEIRRRVLGPEHPATLICMGNLASTLWAMGDHPAARALEEQVLETHRRVLGPEHPATLISMGNLASTLWSMGDHAGARTLEEQVLEIRRRVLGPEHPDTLTSMCNLAVTLLNHGDTAKAEALLREALPVALRTYPQAPITKALQRAAVELRITLDTLP
jgi:tetratricopeptide (TPR) repeat protein